MTEAMRQWVIYKNPTDFVYLNTERVELYVARLWLIEDGEVRASEVTPYADPYLENVRRFIQAVAPGSVCLTRSEADDPVIVETWL